jgi:ribonuclease HII
MLKQFYEPDKIELGIDEAGRGCLFGPVCVASVIWLDKDPNPDLVIRDSKKMSEKKRNLLRTYILDNSISSSVKFIDNEMIDRDNILESTMKGMHECIDDVSSKIDIDTLLIDGPHFNMYDGISHVCVVNGDNTYKSIAAASILAKTFRDEYINSLVDEHPELERYDIRNNKGYGTRKHLEAIKEHGITKWHRKTFGICKKF